MITHNHKITINRKIGIQYIKIKPPCGTPKYIGNRVDFFIVEGLMIDGVKGFRVVNHN